MFSTHHKENDMDRKHVIALDHFDMLMLGIIIGVSVTLALVALAAEVLS